MDITEDTIPELQPVFSFLNSHSNKLYQEGYFLKLDDQNTRTYYALPPLFNALVQVSTTAVMNHPAIIVLGAAAQSPSHMPPKPHPFAQCNQQPR